MTLIEQPGLAIRLMRDDSQDHGLMAKWLSDERVLEYVYGRDNRFDLARVVAKFGPKARGEDEVVPCILEYRDIPVGYLQYYPVQDAAWYQIDTVESVLAIDMYIGEPAHWDRGIGTKALRMLMGYLFSELGANRIVIDPHVANRRAVRCYEKSGFKKVKVLKENELHEGAYRDCWLMVVDVPSPSPARG